MRAAIFRVMVVIGAIQHHALTFAAESKDPIRVGIIGCDTSHVSVFSQLIKDGEAGTARLKLVAAFPGGSEDIPESFARIPQYTDELKANGVEIVDSVEALLPLIDAVLLESVDGRKHLEQARPVLAAKKPVFVDKPVAGTLSDAIELFRLAEQYGTPCFSSSSLRYVPKVAELQNHPSLKRVHGCSVYAPCKLEPHHPDLFWYGVHGVEILFTLMGPGCESVTRTHTDGADVVVGTWKDGRIGTYRGLRNGPKGYGATVFGDRANIAAEIRTDYNPLMQQIAIFFETKTPPVTAQETIEIFGFMEAADESKRQGGKPISIESVIKKTLSRKQVSD